MSDIDDHFEDYLAHYGVKGMKWGVRRSQAALDRAAGRKKRNSRNENYTNQQRKRDRSAYGARGERRINRRMNKGDSVSNARSPEVTRRNKALRSNRYARQTGKLAGGAAGTGIGLLTTRALRTAARNPAVRAFIDRFAGSGTSNTISSLLNTPQAMAAITVGSARVGYLLTGDIAVSANMRARGYDPNRAR